jgi:signal transduction histidine kinase/ActR/RegA family two-component response regulator
MFAPAFLVSLSSLKILASNPPLLAKHGARFSEGSSVRLPPQGSCCEESAWLALSENEQGACFEATCAGGPGAFRTLRAGKDALVIFEHAMPHAAPSSKSCPECGGHESAFNGPFHFSYMESVATGRRSYPHPAALRKIGLLEDGQTELDWRSIIDKSQLPLYDAAIANAKAHGGSHELAYSIKAKDGRAIQIDDFFTLAPPEDGKWPLIVGTVMSRHPLEEDLRSLKHLELQGRLLGGMVHDFKNLLGGIQNIIEWSMTLAKDKPELSEALGKTLSYTSQATKLITGTLRMGSSRRELKTELVNLPSIVKELEALIRHTIPSSIELELDLDRRTPRIYAQRDAFKDIVLNLCVNARDAMCKRGRSLRISVAPREIPGEAGHPQLFAALSVCDDGCGMDASHLANLFEAFQTTKDHGVGLGLWMVSKTVKSLDGKINVSSEPGKGTCFELLFPAAPESERSAPTEFQEPQQKKGRDAEELRKFREGAPKTILYVEDDPLIRSSVAAWLDSIGFVIVESDNGLDALEIFKARAQSIDMVLQDLVIPGRRGEDLLDEILKIKPDVPVIVASANPDDEQIEALRQRGACAFLAKPFLMEELLDILCKIFKAQELVLK